MIDVIKAMRRRPTNTAMKTYTMSINKSDVESSHFVVSSTVSKYCEFLSKSNFRVSLDLGVSVTSFKEHQSTLKLEESNFSLISFFCGLLQLLVPEVSISSFSLEEYIVLPHIPTNIPDFEPV